MSTDNHDLPDPSQPKRPDVTPMIPGFNPPEDDATPTGYVPKRETFAVVSSIEVPLPDGANVTRNVLQMIRPFADKQAGPVMRQIFLTYSRNTHVQSLSDASKAELESFVPAQFTAEAQKLRARVQSISFTLTEKLTDRSNPNLTSEQITALTKEIKMLEESRAEMTSQIAVLSLAIAYENVMASVPFQMPKGISRWD